jgi:hypothetical protein
MDTLITLKETTMKTYLNHWTSRCFFPVWLTFKQAGEVKVDVYVQTPQAAAQPEKHQH